MFIFNRTKIRFYDFAYGLFSIQSLLIYVLKGAVHKLCRLKIDIFDSSQFSYFLEDLVNCYYRDDIVYGQPLMLKFNGGEVFL